ncbi:MAG TPA: hypothetical protein VFC68_04370, partial [Treponemataceae bacterium]|nr:hypothetical protein [Treponemataceae bacterium]
MHEFDLLLNSISSVSFCVLSKPSKKATYKKITIRPYLASSTTKTCLDEGSFFAEFFTQEQSFHTTLNHQQVKNLLFEQTGVFFKNVVITSNNTTYTILT